MKTLQAVLSSTKQLSHSLLCFLSTPKKQLLARWLIWFSFFNSLALSLLAIPYIHYMPQIEGGLASLYLPLAFLGHFGFLAYLAVLPLFLLLRLWPNHWLIITLGIATAVTGVVLLEVDTLVYAQYRFHLSGFILDLALNSGNEVFDFSDQTWNFMLLLVILVFGFELLFAWLLWRYRNRLRFTSFSVFSVLVALLTSHAIHAWADANYARQITGLTRHIPAYHPATARDFFERHHWVNMEKSHAEHTFSLNNNTGDLRYPLKPLSCGQPKKPLNLLMIVIDSWRADTLDQYVSPHIQKFADGAQTLRFNHHLSGGNSTRAGIFSLFYGIPATYWEDMYGNQISPVLIDQLIEQDYRFGIFSSSKLTSPAFDRTVFKNVPHLRLSSVGSEPWLRDESVLQNWHDFIELCQDDRPFFSFLFFDSVHGYSFPDNHPQLFQPVWEEVHHLELNDQFDPEPYRNRYKVAVHYVDSLVGEVLDTLKQQHLLDNTVVMISGDHGEEFNDSHGGYWGHGSNFTPYQTRTPLLIHWPGHQAKQFNHSTNHMDIVPTLLQEFLQCSNPSSDYSSGRSLFDTNPRPWTVIGSYFNYGIVEKDRVTITYPTGHYEIVDQNNQMIRNAKQHPQAIMGALQEMTHFYQTNP